MPVSKRLSELYKSTKSIPFDDNSKIILMSDCHRGDSSFADNFAPNEHIYYAALNYYYNKGYTYIEIGDGDDLWQFADFTEIKEAYSRIYKILYKFYIDKRLYMIWGNHDAQKKDEEYLKSIQIFDGLEVHEGLVLKHSEVNLMLFLFHGHQADKLWGSNRLWKFNQFLMRFVWKPMELYLGFKDPTSPARNYQKKDAVDENIIAWVKQNKQAVIAGHTHRPLFPAEGESPYFNTGSCVHPRSITGIEIENGGIALIKWSIQTKIDGTLFAAREILAGPKKLKTLLGKRGN